MNHEALQRLLDDVKGGTLDTRDASERILEALRAAPFEDLGFARVDTHREVRQGFPEVILGVGKTPAQIAGIADRIVARGQTLLVTRATREAFDAVRTVAPCSSHALALPIYRLRKRRRSPRT
jgi:NCAIR mutase (PurE)-related protein